MDTKLEVGDTVYNAGMTGVINEIRGSWLIVEVLISPHLLPHEEMKWQISYVTLLQKGAPVLKVGDVVDLSYISNIDCNLGTIHKIELESNEVVVKLHGYEYDPPFNIEHGHCHSFDLKRVKLVKRAEENVEQKIGIGDTLRHNATRREGVVRGLLTKTGQVYIELNHHKYVPCFNMGTGACHIWQPENTELIKKDDSIQAGNLVSTPKPDYPVGRVIEVTNDTAKVLLSDFDYKCSDYHIFDVSELARLDSKAVDALHQAEHDRSCQKKARQIEFDRLAGIALEKRIFLEMDDEAAQDVHTKTDNSMEGLEELPEPYDPWQVGGYLYTLNGKFQGEVAKVSFFDNVWNYTLYRNGMIKTFPVEELCDTYDLELQEAETERKRSLKAYVLTFLFTILALGAGAASFAVGANHEVISAWYAGLIQYSDLE